MSFPDLLPAETGSPEATQALGRRLADRLRPGDVVALVGGLGAGKTHLAKGVAEGLGLDPDDVTSPTFTIVHEHEAPGRLFLHLDLYRVETAVEAARLGLGELLSGEAVAVVEWPENAHGLLPPDTLWLTLTPTRGDGRRIEETAR
ncbi:MAG TPA: tRNA (adenosine(37)-N6)-threonylcarbamoyltransferase complex ATPase subunit type 1 TsaE [Rubricoccaceae bacterium]